MSPHELPGLFLPIFVSIDPVALLAPYTQMTSGLREGERRRFLLYSVLVAAGVGLAFIPFGQGILHALGIRNSDFQIAGGILLLVVAMRDIVWDAKMARPQGHGASGVVPFGIPLLVGPAVLASLVLLTDRYGAWQAALSLLVNLGLAWLFFSQASRILRWLGANGILVLSKLSALLLAAYAVMMVRVGLTVLLKN